MKRALPSAPKPSRYTARLRHVTRPPYKATDHSSAVSLTACHSPPYEHEVGAKGLVGFTGPVELVVPDATGPITLDYAIQASKGSWRVELIQPSGEVLRAKDEGAAKGKLVGTDGRGRWLGRIHFRDFSGSYAATLK